MKAPAGTDTVRILLAHGASVDDIGLDPDDPKPPSVEVAEILRARLESEAGEV